MARLGLLTVAILTMLILAVATLTVAILTMFILAVATLTAAILTAPIRTVVMLTRCKSSTWTVWSRAASPHGPRARRPCSADRTASHAAPTVS